MFLYRLPVISCTVALIDVDVYQISLMCKGGVNYAKQHTWTWYLAEKKIYVLKFYMIGLFDQKGT